WGDFGNDGLLEPATFFQCRLGGPCLFFLFRRLEENGTPVLAAAIDKLTVGVGGIHVAPEPIQQLSVADLVRIIDYLHRFGVAGGTAGDLLIGGVGLVTAGVATDGLADTVEFLEVRLGAPETSASEHRRGLRRQ